MKIILKRMKHLSLITLLILLGFQVFAQAPPSYFFVMLNSNPKKAQISEEEADKIQAAHMANMDSLAVIGKLVAAGPFHGGGGMFILNAESLDAADKMIKSDPAIKADRFITELYPLEMVLGSICPQTGKKYDMAEYQFIKYQPVPEKLEGADEKKFNKLTKRHTKFFTDNIFSVRLIAAGNFGSSDGGFLIVASKDVEVIDRLLLFDPWTKSGYFSSKLKVLWIAEGSFCEEGF